MKRPTPGTLAIALSMIACVAVVGCERVKNAPEAGSNVAVPAFEWRVRDADTLAAQYEAAGKNPGSKAKAEGFIGRDQATGAVVIYTQPPRYVDDSVACTLGHEVMHAAIGDYHRERGAN